MGDPLLNVDQAQMLIRIVSSLIVLTSLVVFATGWTTAKVNYVLLSIWLVCELVFCTTVFGLIPAPNRLITILGMIAFGTGVLVMHQFATRAPTGNPLRKDLLTAVSLAVTFLNLIPAVSFPQP